MKVRILPIILVVCFCLGFVEAIAAQQRPVDGGRVTKLVEIKQDFLALVSGEPTFDPDRSAQEIKEKLKNIDANLSDIGADDLILHAAVQGAWVRRGWQLVAELHATTSPTDFGVSINSFAVVLERTGLALWHFGTSHDSLCAKKRVVYEVAAKRQLAELRVSMSGTYTDYSIFLYYVAESNLPIEHFGVTLTEASDLLKSGQFREAQQYYAKWLLTLTEGADLQEEKTAFMILAGLLESSGRSVEHLTSDDKELVRLRNRYGAELVHRESMRRRSAYNTIDDDSPAIVSGDAISSVNDYSCCANKRARWTLDCKTK